jgi:TonB family protein
MKRSHPGFLIAALLATPSLTRAEVHAKPLAGGQARGVVTKPPRVTHFVAPAVPEGVKLAYTAKVELELAIGADGKVSDADVLNGSGVADLDEAAKTAARARRGGARPGGIRGLGARSEDEAAARRRQNRAR